MGRQDHSQPASTAGFVVLGLLGDGPRSGYDLAALAGRTVAHFWPVTRSHIYGELPRLEEAGLVRGRDVPQEGVPDKRIYRVTAAGRKALHQWLTHADLGEPRLHHPLLLRLFFGSALDAGEIDARLAEHAQTAQARRALYQTYLARAGEARAETSAQAIRLRQLVLRYAIRRQDEELAWVEEVRKTLAEG